MYETDEQNLDRLVTELHCQLGRKGCTGIGRLVEDPYEADVNNRPGVMIRACDHCLSELALDI